VADVQTKPFPNYQELPARLPEMVWWGLRLIVAAATLYVIYLVVADPEQGMTVFWRLLVPSLPLLFAAAPGIWRQVCPMALVNQLPRTFGLSRERRLPPWLKNVAFLIATIAFFLLVSLRHLFFNENSMSLIILMIGALTLAFVGGLVFAGRSGWCGTLCPLAPIQKAYGHAPLLVERNGYCPTCVGCQKNCYDFNPRAAFLTDLNDRDPWYAGHKQFFVAALPGFAIAFFTAPDPRDVGLGAYYSYLFTWMVGTTGLFYLCRSLIRLSNFRASAIAAMSALVIFYYFAAEGIVATFAALLGIAPPEYGPEVIQAAALVVAASVLWKGYGAERDYEALNAEQSGGRTSVDVAKASAAARSAEGLITEKASGRSFAADPDRSLLEGIENAGLSIDFGCRMGMCGADPVVVAEGAEHLDPPSETELATLRRLGLEGRARLACVCRAAKGPVVIDLETDPATLPEPEPAADAVDHAAKAGIEKIVVIGNGAAGSTAASELRRLGPSASIVLIAQETHPFYNRMAIGRLLYETQGIEDLYFASQSSLAKKNINLRLNTLTRAIDRDAQRVLLGTGESLAYDRLFLATGAQAFAPPIPGIDKPGAFVLREASDAQAIRAWRQSEDC
jgi:ferredoxin